MLLQPIMYTTRMEEAVEWWTAVLDVSPDHQSEVWSAFGVGSATLALHHVDELPGNSRVALSLVSTEPLESVMTRLTHRGIEPHSPIVAQPFGRQVAYRDADGNLIQINEHGS